MHDFKWPINSTRIAENAVVARAAEDGTNSDGTGSGGGGQSTPRKALSFENAETAIVITETAPAGGTVEEEAWFKEGGIPGAHVFGKAFLEAFSHSSDWKERIGALKSLGATMSTADEALKAVTNLSLVYQSVCFVFSIACTDKVAQVNTRIVTCR